VAAAEQAARPNSGPRRAAPSPRRVGVRSSNRHDFMRLQTRQRVPVAHSLRRRARLDSKRTNLALSTTPTPALSVGERVA
jgi:hypothetical protein